MRILLCVCLAGLVLGLLGCSHQATPGEAESALVNRAADLIGPADRYHATVTGLTATRVKSICFVAVGMKPDPNQIIDPLTLTLNDVQYQAQPFHVTSVGDVSFEARISEAAVNSNLRQQGRTTSTNLKNVRVEFQRGLVKITTSVPVMNAIDVPVATTGRLVLVDGVRANYELQTVRVNGLGVPATLRGLLTSLVNPLVDLSGLRFTPRATRVTIEPGAIILRGRALLRTLD